MSKKILTWLLVLVFGLGILASCSFDSGGQAAIGIAKNYNAGGCSLNSKLENSGGMGYSGVIWKATKIGENLYNVSAQAGGKNYLFKVSISDDQITPENDEARKIMW